MGILNKELTVEEFNEVLFKAFEAYKSMPIKDFRRLLGDLPFKEKIFIKNFYFDLRVPKSGIQVNISHGVIQFGYKGDNIFMIILSEDNTTCLELITNATLFIDFLSSLKHKRAYLRMTVELASGYGGLLIKNAQNVSLNFYNTTYIRHGTSKNP